MSGNEFIEQAKSLVYRYTVEHLDKSDEFFFSKNDDVYVVWSCKILKDNKALLSTSLFDGMYYEVTYNGDRQEFYLDAYKKFENRCIKAG